MRHRKKEEAADNCLLKVLADSDTERLRILELLKIWSGSRDFFVFKGLVSKLRFIEKWLSSVAVKQENEFMMIFKELQRRTKSFSKKRKRRRRDVFGGF